MILHRYDPGIPIDQVARETQRAMDGWDWSRGAFGHALSLPRAEDLHPYGRYSYPNYPCTGLLERMPILKEYFASLACDKVSFRLLRRGPRSSYEWHTDRWKGPGVVRFQIPIVSDADSLLILTDYESPAQLEENGRWTPEAAAADAIPPDREGRVRRYQLESGALYYFDTTRVHTLVNRSASERITLSFDLVANDWLVGRFPAIRAEIGDGPPPRLPVPGGVRQAAAFARSRFFPLRSLARRLREHGSGRAL